MFHSNRAARTILVGFALLCLSACSSPEERAQSYLARGEQFAAKNDDVKAGIEFRNALRNKKDLLPAWRGLAKIEEKRKNYEALGPLLRTIVELDPSDVDARLKLGRLMLLAGAASQALALINPALEGEKPPASLLALRATIMFRLNDTDAALRDAHRVLEIEPKNLDALLVISFAQLSRGDADGALRTIEAVQADPDQEVALILMRLQIFEKMKDVKRIETEARRLLEIASDKQAVRKQLVRFYLANRRELDAERELRTAASAEPDNFEAGMEVIRFVILTKGRDAGRQEFAERIKAGGDVVPYQIALAQLEYLAGNKREANQTLEQLVAKTTNLESKRKIQVALASMLVADKNLNAAEGVISEILKSDKRNADGLKLRALINIERGQFENAIANLRDALNDQPRSVELLQVIAQAYEKSGSIELADKSFADATRASNFAPDAGLMYASFLERRSNISHLEDLLTELATRNINNVEVWSSLGRVRLQRGDWVGAQQAADVLKRLGDRRADELRGEALSGQNKINEGIQALHEAFSRNANNIRPMVALVRAYLRASKPDEAETFLKGVLTASPNNAEAYALLGTTRLAKGQREQAEADFKTAIKKQPNNVIGYNALAELYFREKQNDEALKTMQAGLRERPDDFGLQLGLAAVLEAKGDIDGAIREYESMLEKRPDSLIVVNNLASLLSDYRGDKESLGRAQSLTAVLRKSNIPNFKDTLGWVYYQSGDYRNALPLLEEAVAVLPNQSLVRYHLGMTYIALGQRDRGLEQLKKADELEQAETITKKKIQSALKQEG